MTYLKPIADALREQLGITAQDAEDEAVAVHECTRCLVLPSVAELVQATGLHPIADGRTLRGRHAYPWTPTQAYCDAYNALHISSTSSTWVPLHRDDDTIGGAFPLLPGELEAARWTVGALTL